MTIQDDLINEINTELPTNAHNEITAARLRGVLIDMVNVPAALTSYVSIADYGASPSATAAVNTTAINAALATGRAVFVPGGTYLHNAFSITKEGQRLFGNGRSNFSLFGSIPSRLVLASGQNTDGITIGNYDNTGQNVVIEDLTIDGNSANQAGGSALLVTGGTHVFQLNRCIVIGGYLHNIHVRATTYNFDGQVVIANSRIIDYPFVTTPRRGHGIYFDGAIQSCVVSNCEINGSAPGWFIGSTYQTGYYVVASDDHLYLSIVDGNVGNDPTTDGGVHWTDLGAKSVTAGVYTENTADIVVTNCNIWSEDKKVVVVNSSWIQINDNFIHADNELTAQEGVILNASTHNTVVGNAFWALAGSGVVLKNGSVNNTVTGNSFSTNNPIAPNAILEQDTSDYNIFSSNAIVGTYTGSPTVVVVGANTKAFGNTGCFDTGSFISSAVFVGNNSVVSGATLAFPAGTIGTGGAFGANNSIAIDLGASKGFEIAVAGVDKVTMDSAGTLSITPTPSSFAKGFAITQSGPASSTASDFFYNTISITDSIETTSPAGYTIGFLTDLIIDGTAPIGLEKVALAGFTSHFGAATDTGGDFIAVFGSARAASPNGGTNTGAGAKGTLYGSTMVAWAFSGATNYLVVSGCEYDTIIEAGASARYRWGISLVGGGAVRGADSDAAIEIGSGNAATSAFSTGILFSNAHGSGPLPATGTVIGADGSSVTVANFADFSTYTFTGNIFNFGSVFSVSGTGTVVAGLFSSYGGTSIVIQQDGGVAMLMAGTTSFRNSKNGASIMNFDVSTGGATHGSFIWHSSNAFTTLATLDSTTLDLPSTLTVAGGTIASNTSADGVILRDATAATSGNQQYSPRIRLTGQGWKTDAGGASQAVDWYIENRPVQGTSNPTSELRFSYQANGGGYNNRMLLFANDVGAQTTLQIDNTGSSQYILNVGGTSYGVLYGDSSQVIVGSNQNVPFILNANNAEKARLNATGELGIGKTATTLLDVNGPVATKASATKTNDYTLVAADSALIFNGSGSITLTLQSAASYPGRWLYVKTIANQAVNSATAVVVPISTATAGTVIVTNTAGKWAALQSDGTNWVTMAVN